MEGLGDGPGWGRGASQIQWCQSWGLKISSGPGVSQMGEQEAQASEAMLNSAPWSFGGSVVPSWSCWGWCWPGGVFSLL